MTNSLIKLNAIIKKDELYERILLKTLTILNSIDYDTYSKFSNIVEECFNDALHSKKSWMELFNTLFHVTDDGIITVKMGKEYYCVLFYHIGEIFNEFTIPPFLRVSMKLTRNVINTYSGNIEYIEDLEPVYKYQMGGSRFYPSVPYYRESKSSKTRRYIQPLQKHISLDTYFHELKRQKSKTRRIKHEI